LILVVVDALVADRGGRAIEVHAGVGVEIPVGGDGLERDRIGELPGGGQARAPDVDAVARMIFRIVLVEIRVHPALVEGLEAVGNSKGILVRRDEGIRIDRDGTACRACSRM
jgi:hypothetical protein